MNAQELDSTVSQTAIPSRRHLGSDNPYVFTVHAVQDAGTVIVELKRVMTEKGSVTLTTLVKNNRLADRYIDNLGKMGALAPRSLAQLLEIFEDIDMHVEYLAKGNLAFLHHGKHLDYFQALASRHAGGNHE